MQQEREAWLTPAEIFAPWYSRALAKYMLGEISGPLHVYEIGGGSGTNAVEILNYMREHHPKVYETMQYTLIEISPVLAQRQASRIQDHRMANVVQSSIHDWTKKVKPGAFVIALEVLDNLPHDKVVLQDGQWFETVVSDWTESKRPLQDALIAETLQYFPIRLPYTVQYKHSSRYATDVIALMERLAHWLRGRIFPKVEPLMSAFVPTGCMQLLKVLHTYFPKHRLIAADFDFLPPPELPASSMYHVLNHPDQPTAASGGTLHAVNAPIVASKLSGETKDHDTYILDGEGTADIFFATDFARLKGAYCAYTGRKHNSVSVIKSRAFMQSHAELEKTKTILGYNPLLRDYENMSLMIS